MYIIVRALHARVNLRLCHSLLTIVAWVTVLPRKRCCDSYLSYLWRWVSGQLGARYREEGQTAEDAPAGYATLFWDFFCVGTFRLHVTKFFLEFLEYYKIHISQLHPIGMVRVRHFEFVCRTMHIEPTVPRFRVFHQMQCSQGFYSFVQRASAKKILLNLPKSFHD
ncbi:hypothetical protein Hanom_Chr13g01219131 [Helianthus anomalus]